MRSEETWSFSRRGGWKSGEPSSPKSALLLPSLSHLRRRRARSAVVVEELMLPSCSLRRRRRRARRPAISVTCGSMNRCGCTVLPVGSTKPHKAVSLAVLALYWARHRPRLRFKLSRRRRPVVVVVSHRFVISVPFIRGEGGGERRGRCSPLVAGC